MPRRKKQEDAPAAVVRAPGLATANGLARIQIEGGDIAGAWGAVALQSTILADWAKAMSTGPDGEVDLELWERALSASDKHARLMERAVKAAENAKKAQKDDAPAKSYEVD